MNQQVGCIGNFDGLHVGHQALIEVTKKIAQEENCKPHLITFATHPRLQDAGLFLTTQAERNRMVHNLGVEKVIALDFPGSISSMTPEEFVIKILIHSLQMRHIVVGENFRFGKDRSGSVATLQFLGKKYHFEVTTVPMQKWNGEIICSSSIRECIRLGKLETATKMLNYPYFIRGQVVSGNKVGRTMGIPTANLQILEDTKCMPCSGVYVTYTIMQNRLYESITHIGPKPTFREQEQKIETYLLTNHGNFYQENQIILWIRKIREVLSFPDKELLSLQIRRDIQEVEAYLRENQIVSIPPILNGL